jgi:hypothetical protein
MDIRNPIRGRLDRAGIRRRLGIQSRGGRHRADILLRPDIQGLADQRRRGTPDNRNSHDRMNRDASDIPNNRGIHNPAADTQAGRPDIRTKDSRTKDSRHNSHNTLGAGA